jgi:hypothetical protein
MNVHDSYCRWFDLADFGVRIMKETLHYFHNIKKNFLLFSECKASQMNEWKEGRGRAGRKVSPHFWPPLYNYSILKTMLTNSKDSSGVSVATLAIGGRATAM